MLALVLHHLPDPGAVLAEAARVLKAGGRLVVADMLPHDRDEYRQTMGHVWLGFSEKQIEKLLRGAGFDAIRILSMPAESQAKGPALFVAAAAQRTASPDSTTPITAITTTRRESMSTAS